MPVFLVAVPAEVFIAFALLLLLFAVRTLLVQPITTLLEHVPLIGGTVAGAINDVVGTVIDIVAGWAKWGVDAMLQLVQVPIEAVQNFVAMVGSLADTVAGAIARVASVAAGQVGRVADALASLVAKVGGLASSMAWAVTHINELIAKAAAIVSTIIP